MNKYSKKLSEDDMLEVSGGNSDSSGWIDLDEVIGTCSRCSKKITNADNYSYLDEVHKKGLICHDCKKKADSQIEMMMDVGF